MQSEFPVLLFEPHTQASPSCVSSSPVKPVGSVQPSQNPPPFGIVAAKPASET